MAHQLPPLSYDYAALEPYIDEATMRLHHTKHHQAYIDKLNAALAVAPSLADQPLNELLRDLSVLPEEIRMAVRNHGGGHVNHSFFWQWLRPASGEGPSGELLLGIEKSFGSLELFKSQFADKATTLFGSGWTWLLFDQGELKITTTSNQDSPLMAGQTPILGLDVWEHAYYLKYQNRRADYIKNFWPIVNWERVASLYQEQLLA